MRIDPNRSSLNEVVRDEEPQKVTSHSSTNPAQNARVEDQITLSADAVSVSALEAKALAVPEVRQDRVDALRQAIQNGQHKVDPEAIANAIIEQDES
jgi:negative regulator of flagellin synthesis FlgM